MGSPNYVTKYPMVEVKLAKKDGNAMTIMGKVGAALREYLENKTSKSAKEIKTEVNTYLDESISNGHDNIIQTARKWVTVL